MPAGSRRGLITQTGAIVFAGEASNTDHKANHIISRHFPVGLRPAALPGVWVYNSTCLASPAQTTEIRLSRNPPVEEGLGLSTTGSAAFFCRYVRTDDAALHTLIRLLVRAPSHIGAALGVVAAKRRIPLRIVTMSTKEKQGRWKA